MKQFTLGRCASPWPSTRTAWPGPSRRRPSSASPTAPRSPSPSPPRPAGRSRATTTDRSYGSAFILARESVNLHCVAMTGGSEEERRETLQTQEPKLRAVISYQPLFVENHLLIFMSPPPRPPNSRNSSGTVRTNRRSITCWAFRRAQNK